MNRAKNFFMLTLAMVVVSCAPAVTTVPVAFTPISPSPTLTPNPTSTPPVSPTPISYSLIFSVFHDLNGNETQNSGEPSVSGIVIRTAGLSCSTDIDGKCEIGKVIPGKYHLSIDPSGSSIAKLGYVFTKKDVMKLDYGLNIDSRENTVVEIALGQGPLPLPMITQAGFGGVYAGFRTSANPTHDGLDLWVDGQSEQPILANIGGVAYIDKTCNHVTIEVRSGGLQFNVGIGHLTRVVIEDGLPVKKGDIIGYVNPSLYNGTRQHPGTVEIACTTQPHVHYNIFGPGGVGFDGDWGWLDPALFVPEIGTPRTLFDTAEDAAEYITFGASS